MIEVGKKWTPPAGWPAMSRDAAKAALCAPGAPFEMEVVDIEDVPTRVWKNALPTLAALAEHTKAFGEREFVVFNDERMTYSDWHRAVATLAALYKTWAWSKATAWRWQCATCPNGRLRSLPPL